MKASEPKTPQASEAEAATPATTGSSRKPRIIFWGILGVVAIAVLAYALTRESEPTSEENAAYTLDFPKGFKEAKSSGKAFAIYNAKQDTTVILSPTSSKRLPLSVPAAKQRLRKLSCGAKARVIKVNGQTTVSAVAPKPCSSFSATAIVFGPRFRVLLACEAPDKAPSAAACRETLRGLHVK